MRHPVANGVDAGSTFVPPPMIELVAQRDVEPRKIDK
jgi:hypothetical protein